MTASILISGAKTHYVESQSRVCRIASTKKKPVSSTECAFYVHSTESFLVGDWDDIFNVLSIDTNIMNYRSIISSSLIVLIMLDAYCQRKASQGNHVPMQSSDLVCEQTVLCNAFAFLQTIISFHSFGLVVCLKKYFTVTMQHS